MYYNVLLRYNKNTRSFLCRHTQITIGKNVLPIKSLLLFHNLEHYQFNYSANLCFYTSQNVIEFSAFVVQYLELCNKCTAKHSTCTGSLVFYWPNDYHPLKFIQGDTGQQGGSYRCEREGGDRHQTDQDDSNISIILTRQQKL